MNIYVLTRCLNNTDDILVAVSVRGKDHVYFQEFIICCDSDIKHNINSLYSGAIQYIIETLIVEKGFSIRYINIIGDISSLPYEEYSSKRKSGIFHHFSNYLRKETELHKSCKELFEYIMKSMNGIPFNYLEWGTTHKGIRIELGKLAGDKYYDEEQALKAFLELN